MDEVLHKSSGAARFYSNASSVPPLVYRDGVRQLSPPVQADHLTRGNRVDLFPTDTLAMEGLVSDIAAAQKKIQFESFLFNDVQGEIVADAMIESRRRGVQVQVLLDGSMAKLDGERLANKLRAAGAEVRYYDTRKLRMPFLAVDHTKIAIVDGRVAWEGGANFDSEINRDLMCRIQGPAERDIQRIFADAWQEAGGIPECLDPPPPAQGDVAVRTTETSPAATTTRTELLDKLRRLRRGDSLDVWMMDLGDPQVVQELLAANHRGVNMRVLLDGTPPFIGKVHKAIRPFVRDWLDGMPDVNTIIRLQSAGVPVRLYEPPPGITKLHSKVAIFTYHDRVPGPDGRPRRVPRQEVMTGSTNWNRSALGFNHEMAAFMSGGDVGGKVEGFFEEDWNQHARPVHAPRTPWEGGWRLIKGAVSGTVDQIF